VQGFTTASVSPYYHTTEDTHDKVNPADLERTTAYITQVTRTVQIVPPELLIQREVPTVKVTAPASANTGAAVPVDIAITGIDGRPISNDRVRVLALQKDNWAVAESFAEPTGNGHYRWTLPAGSTDASVTDLRATTSTATYFAQGYARIDMRKGGLASAAAACRSRRVIDLAVRASVRGRKVTRLRVAAARGKARVRKTRSGYRVRVDLRGVRKGTIRVRLTARTARGTIVQTRTYRTCVRTRS
jgi:predicted secreted protein